MNLVLIGYMGSGKSLVGKRLADTLNYKYLDLDEVISTREQKTISEIFSERGEIYFRRIEGELLKEILDSQDNIVLATGGGTPCYGNTMDFISSTDSSLSVYLSSTLDTLTERLFDERSSRPLIAHLPDKELLKDFIRKHLFERSFYYNQADHVVDVSEGTPDELVKKIVALLF